MSESVSFHSSHWVTIIWWVAYAYQACHPQTRWGLSPLDSQNATNWDPQQLRQLWELRTWDSSNLSHSHSSMAAVAGAASARRSERLPLKTARLRSGVSVVLRQACAAEFPRIFPPGNGDLQESWAWTPKDFIIFMFYIFFPCSH